jgi:hypothetical protein
MNDKDLNFPMCRLGNDCQISFHADDYRGEGASEGLSRGILVFSEGRNLTGEGMGIGSVAFRRKGFTYFSTRYTTQPAGDDSLERVFLLDTWRQWAVNGYPSASLTRFIEWTADCYMALPWAQPVLGIQSPLIKALSLHPFLKQVSPLGRAVFRYSFPGQEIHVSCSIESCGADLPGIFVLNELDGEIFCRSFRQGRYGPPPSGWCPCPEDSYLSSQDGDIRFFLDCISVDVPGSWEVFWGREQTNTLRWAGFNIRIDPDPGTRKVDCSYILRFEGNTGQEEG